jgi:hypothetical protein
MVQVDPNEPIAISTFSAIAEIFGELLRDNVRVKEQAQLNIFRDVQQRRRNMRPWDINSDALNSWNINMQQELRNALLQKRQGSLNSVKSIRLAIEVS